MSEVPERATSTGQPGLQHSHDPVSVLGYALALGWRGSCSVGEVGVRERQQVCVDSPLPWELGPLWKRRLELDLDNCGETWAQKRRVQEDTRVDCATFKKERVTWAQKRIIQEGSRKEGGTLENERVARAIVRRPGNIIRLSRTKTTKGRFAWHEVHIKQTGEAMIRRMRLSMIFSPISPTGPPVCHV